MRTKTLTLLLLLAAAFTMATGSTFVSTAAAAGTPGPGFNLDAADVRFILRQIQISENHAAQTRLPGNAPNCSVLLGPGPLQIPDPRLPYGLRTVDGRCNNLVPGQESFASSFTIIPRLTTPFYRTAEQGTSYLQNSGTVFDSRPRIISNLIVDQTANNPAAVEAAGPLPVIEPSGAFFIPNVATDAGLSAPYNALFTFFGQFFDHGLTLLRKGGSGTVLVPLQPDDPLNNCFPPLDCNVVPPGLIPLTRATNLPGPDGILGTLDDIKEGTNEDTPWIDQQQTYTSHPSHQVFLRQYQLVGGRPVPTGRLMDGAVAGNIANWAETKAQASTLLGIALEDIDVLSVPLLLTDPYGHFVPGPNGFPQVAMPDGSFVEGNPAGPVSVAGSLKVGTAFLCDIAFAADPSVPGYDPALLNAHFVPGDCRGNENIGLTFIHNVFHSEHNRVAADIDGLITTLMTPAEIANWHADNPASGWGYGERLFQAARFVTEMEYQRIVIDTFARKFQPMVNPFAGVKTNIDPTIEAEFSHASYRFGHSMLNEIVGRTNADGSVNDISLLGAFLNPLEYNNGGPAGSLTAAQTIGALARGLSRQVGNEIDEFVTEALRNQLLGVPLDLAAINMTRGRSEGVAPLNVVRRELFAATGDPALAPYANWFEFWLALRHPESLVNFVAAYGTDPSITGATTVADKRAAATALVCVPGSFPCLVNTSAPLLAAPAATSGLDDVDLWVGGNAEKPSQFGGLLGSTSNYIFESQMEKLQDFDRFYYVARFRGLNLLAQVEQNSLSELIMRNSDFTGLADDPFARPGLVFDLANPILDPVLIVGPGGTIVYPVDPTVAEHVVFVCGAADCRVQSSGGDDTLRGGPGNDRLEGGQGNDVVSGGPGDDIITNQFGDDVLQGGDGNDAISCGPNLGGAFMFGGSGQDFLVAGSDPCQAFGGPGNDFMYTGDGAKIPIGNHRGEEGDDWIEGGLGSDLLIGDCNGLEGQVDFCTTGDDVLLGGSAPGALGDEFLGEGGDDISAPGAGKSINKGGYGYDWVTYKYKPTPADGDLNILIVDPLDQNFFRDRFAMVEALSGGPFNDVLLGDNRSFGGTVFTPPIPGQTCDPVLAPGVLETTFYCNELSPAGIAKIAGLDALLAGRTLPPGDPHAGTFAHGNILLGGPGSDMIMGRDGDDIIDGDAWLNVQLRAVLNDGTVKLVDNMLALVADVFADPQRLNPGNITIVRSIVGHTGAAGTDVDTAVYRKARSFYTVTVNADGSITVADNLDPRCVGGDPAGRLLAPCDGTDTLWNIERIAFPDGTLDVATNGFTPKAGLGAALNVTPTALTFTAVVGTTSVPQAVTVPNISPVNISLFSFTITGVNAADFAVTNNCPGVLAPATSCTASVTFTPTATGVRSAVLNITSNDPLSPATIPLTGAGTFPPTAPVSTSVCPTTAQVGVLYTCTVVATDINGDVLTYSLVAPVPAGMVINAATGVISWTPTAAGSFPVTVQATDPGGLFASQSFTVAVSLVAGAPVANPDTATTRAGRSVVIRVLANDTAAVGSTLNLASIRIVTPPAHGTAIPNVRGTVTYTPNPGFTGVDTFTYDVKDNLGRTSNAATVTVTVR